RAALILHEIDDRLDETSQHTAPKPFQSGERRRSNCRRVNPAPRMTILGWQGNALPGPSSTLVAATATLAHCPAGSVGFFVRRFSLAKEKRPVAVVKRPAIHPPRRPTRERGLDGSLGWT